MINMYNENMGIEYNSDYILIVSKNWSEDILVIGLDDINPKIKVFHTWFNPPYNEDIENAIEEVLHNSGYDIEYELELYRESKFYQMLKENEEM